MKQPLLVLCRVGSLAALGLMCSAKNLRCRIILFLQRPIPCLHLIWPGQPPELVSVSSILWPIILPISLTDGQATWSMAFSSYLLQSLLLFAERNNHLSQLEFFSGFICYPTRRKTLSERHGDLRHTLSGNSLPFLHPTLFGGRLASASLWRDCESLSGGCRRQSASARNPRSFGRGEYQ